MAKNVALGEVFKALGQPTTTYVERQSGRFERELSHALNEKGTLCLLTGPSKTGKTTLYSKVIKNRQAQPLIIRCHCNLKPIEFWRMALENIDFERLKSIQVIKGGTASGSGKVSGKIGWSWLAGLAGEVSTGVSKTRSETKIRE